MSDLKEWPEREDGVQELVSSWSKFINQRPALISFLYDFDLLPEQIVSIRGARSLDAVCSVYQAGEEGKIPAAPAATPAEKEAK